jgi:DNA-binding YbaB/EbfC family protein
MAKKSRPGGIQGGGQNVMAQIQQLQNQMVKAQEELAEEQVTGSAGGGVVKVTITGDQQVLSVELDPALLEEDDLELVQDLILAAVNQGLDLSRELAAKKLGPLAGGGLPF